jgi:hypothetical protein
MAEGHEWLDERIKRSKKSHPLINDLIVSRLRHQITSPVGERALNRAEAEEIAKALIADLDLTE